jgi:hypothetical protein
MEVAQISVFLENRSGGLADAVEVLAKKEIDIKAVTLADMAEFGILRLIVADPERARTVLRQAGFTVHRTGVVAVQVPDRPGGLGDALQALRRSGINIEYVYAAARRSGERAILIFRFDELVPAVDALRGAGITVLDRFEDP